MLPTATSCSALCPFVYTLQASKRFSAQFTIHQLWIHLVRLVLISQLNPLRLSIHTIGQLCRESIASQQAFQPSLPFTSTFLFHNTSSKACFRSNYPRPNGLACFPSIVSYHLSFCFWSHLRAHHCQEQNWAQLYIRTPNHNHALRKSACQVTGKGGSCGSQNLSDLPLRAFIRLCYLYLTICAHIHTTHQSLAVPPLSFI